MEDNEHVQGGTTCYLNGKSAHFSHETSTLMPCSQGFGTFHHIFSHMTPLKHLCNTGKYFILSVVSFICNQLQVLCYYGGFLSGEGRK